LNSSVAKNPAFERCTFLIYRNWNFDTVGNYHSSTRENVAVVKCIARKEPRLPRRIKRNEMWFVRLYVLRRL